MPKPHVPATAAVVLAMLGGCGGPSDTFPSGTDSGNAWRPPAGYEYVLESSCGERALIGEFRVAVEDGEVAEVEALDEPAQRLLDASGTEAVPTLGELLDQVAAAREEGADVVEVATDPSDGHPTRIDIDWDTNAVDDEACYVVSDYVPQADAAAAEDEESSSGEPGAVGDAEKDHAWSA